MRSSDWSSYVFSSYLNAHPLDIEGEFAIAQNGTIANTEDIEPLVHSEFRTSESTTDTRLAGLRLLQHYRREKEWTRAFRALSKTGRASWREGGWQNV